MALASYADLQAAVALWLKRTDLTAMIPDFITLVEGRLARDLRLRKQITSATLTTIAGVNTLDLPVDWIETENLGVVASGVVRSLTVMSPEQMDVRFPFGLRQGVPVAYAPIGSTMVLGPTPDAAYDIPVSYYARFPALVASTRGAGANWLLTNHPALYLFGTLAEASVFMLDDERAALWEQKYRTEALALVQADENATRSGAAMRVRNL